MALLVNQEYIRDMNSRLVLQQIINNEPISRTDLAKTLGLTKATVSSIVQTFIDDSYIIESGSLDTIKGRKPILLKFNADCAFTISIDLSVDFITILVSNLRGEKCLLFQHQNDGNTAQLGAQLCTHIQSAIDQCPPSRYGIIGIAVGIHGIVHNNEILFTPYYELSSLNLRQYLEDYFQIPVYIENEANLSALGEKTFYYNYPNLINISIHSGVGLGIIVDHRLYTGLNGYAGEFGHTIVVPDGKPCPCGNHGCFEQYASERAILSMYRDISQKKQATAQELCEAYLRREADAVLCIDQFVKFMAIGLNNVLNIFNPDMVIINSIFTMNIPDLIPQISAQLAGALSKSRLIVPSMLQDMAILLGGACICMKNYLKIENPQFRPLIP